MHEISRATGHFARNQPLFRHVRRRYFSDAADAPEDGALAVAFGGFMDASGVYPIDLPMSAAAFCHEPSLDHARKAASHLPDQLVLS